MSAKLEFIKAHWALIAMVLGYFVNGLINGLTAYPKCETILRFISDLLAPWTHKDSPNTFKAPGKRSKPPVGKKPFKLKEPTVLGMPPASAWWAPFIALSLMVSSCMCVFHGNCKEGTAGFCASKEVSEQAPHLLPILADVFLHGPNNLEEILINLGALLGHDGIDILRCVMGDMVNRSSAHLAAIKAGKPMAAPEKWLNRPTDEVEKIRAGAALWLKKNGGK